MGLRAKSHGGMTDVPAGTVEARAEAEIPVARSRGLAGRARTLMISGVMVGALSVGGSGVAPAVAAECPNAAVSAQTNVSPATGAPFAAVLPDCRGYEMVAPPYKEGAAPVPTGLTDDGNSVLYVSSGIFAGARSGQGIDSGYLARRDPRTGWSTEALNPPATQFPVYAGALNNTPKAFTSDFGTTLWALQGPGEQGTDSGAYYLRDAAGTFTQMSPTISGSGRGGLSPSTLGDPRAASDDLRYVLLNVTGSAVAAPPTDGTVDTRTGNDLLELVGGATPVLRQVAVDNARTTLSPTCTAVAPQPSYGALSADGSRVFFDVCPGTGQQVYARIDGAQTFDASASQCHGARPAGACNGQASADYLGASRDGSKVFFSTAQQLVDGDVDATKDLYECDLSGTLPAPAMPTNPCPNLVPISVTGTTAGAGVLNLVSTSSDGSRVVFTARGVLTGANSRGQTPIAGGANLYVWEPDAAHPGQAKTVFIGAVAATDPLAVTIGTQVCPVVCPAFASRGVGRFLVFSTAAQLLPSDTDSRTDVYRYDADTDALSRIWVTDPAHNGTGRQGDAVIPSLNRAGIGSLASYQGAGATPSRVASDDGSVVVFTTSEALVPQDQNNADDVYEWHDGTVSLISDGVTAASTVAGNAFSGMTPSGSDILFSTSRQMLPQDTDSSNDVYDARIDGGFAAAPAAPAPCDAVADACHGALSPAPSLASPSTGSSIPAGAASGPAPTASPTFVVGAVDAKARQAMAQTGRLTLTVTASQAGSLRATAAARVGKATKTVASAAKTLRSAAVAALPLSLSKAARAALRSKHKLTVTLAVSYSESATVRHVTVKLTEAKATHPVKTSRSTKPSSVPRAARVPATATGR